LFKLMAYKDEYEVARLYVNGDFAAKLRERFEGLVKLRVHLAPPLFARRDAVTGHLVKRPYGPWVLTLFRFLSKMRWLRGTAFDPFGRTRERRMERQLIADYMRAIEDVVAGLTPANREIALAIACLPERIKGFGHVKDANIAAARTEEAGLLALYHDPTRAKSAAE